MMITTTLNAARKDAERAATLGGSDDSDGDENSA